MPEWFGILPGAIWAVTMGLAIGNYATNPIYRLPRGEAVFGKTPFCDVCGHALTPKDLFPLFSWLMTRGACRYCGAGIPVSYLLVELAVPLWFLWCYLWVGYGDHFIVLSFGGTAAVMLLAMWCNDRFFSNKTLVALIVMGFLYRTLEEQTFFGAVEGGVLAGVFALGVWRLDVCIRQRSSASLPPYVGIIGSLGVWLL